MTGTTDSPRAVSARGCAVGVVWLATALSGCAAVAVVDTVATVGVKTVGLAADAAIGTARIAGRVVGAAADAALPDPAPPR